MTDYPIHPAADALPMMNADEHMLLHASMGAAGWDPHRPAVLFEGQILDGRNRLVAADELGLEPVYDDRTEEIDNPWEWVARENLARRSLTPSQRAAIGVKFMPALIEMARARQSEAKTGGVDGEMGRSRDQAAKLTGASPRLIQDASRLDPPRLAQVSAGELTVAAALRELDEQASGEPGQLPANSPPTPARPADDGDGGGATAARLTVDDIVRAATQLDTYDLATAVTRLRQKVRASKEPGADPDSWCTPPEVMDPIREFLGGIGLDPFSNKHSVVGAEVSWTIEDDAFEQDWFRLKLKAHTMYMNPFYSGAMRAFEKFVDVAVGVDRESIAFPKGDWSTDWWQTHIVKRATSICYWAKRVKFILEGGKFATAMFPNAVVYYGTDPAGFKKAFRQFGQVEQLRRRPQ